MRHTRGFTLVELLVCCALIGLVAGAVMAVLSGTFRVWQRLQTQNLQEQWVAVGFSQLRRDLRNVRRFEPIPFDGTYETFSFPSLVDVEDRSGSSWQEVGKIRYSLDRRTGGLCRSQQPYRFLRRVRLTDACQPIVPNVGRLRVSYYRVDPESGTSKWLSSWSSPEPPAAVKIELGYRQPQRRELLTRLLLVHLPGAPAPTVQSERGT